MIRSDGRIYSVHTKKTRRVISVKLLRDPISNCMREFGIFGERKQLQVAHLAWPNSQDYLRRIQPETFLNICRRTPILFYIFEIKLTHHSLEVGKWEL